MAGPTKTGPVIHTPSSWKSQCQFFLTKNAHIIKKTLELFFKACHKVKLNSPIFKFMKGMRDMSSFHRQQITGRSHMSSEAAFAAAAATVPVVLGGPLVA